MKSWKSDEDIIIRHNDLIWVTTEKVVIDGCVKCPGRYPIGHREMTISCLISLAMGTTEDVDLHHVKLIKYENGKYTIAMISVIRDRDFILKPQDIIVIPSNKKEDLKKIEEILPNPDLAKPLCPDSYDLFKLESTKGKTKSEVLRILGHPSKISYNTNGIERWDYPWRACCRIWFKNGRVSGTFYTAGY